MPPRAPESITPENTEAVGTGRRPLAGVARWLAPWQIVVVVAISLYIPWIGQRGLWFPDEPDVAEPAITMVQTGDWVVPRHNDDPWLDYPPLTYWLGAASSHLAGKTSPFALRLPIALIAILLVGLTAWVTHRAAGWQAGLWAGLTLATAPHFVYQAVNYHPDMAFAALSAGGTACYAWGVARHTGWRTVALRAAGFACFGGAVLAKGPLGLLLPGLILVVWHASQRQWRAALAMVPLSLVSLTIALFWYVLLVRAISWEYVWNEVYLQNFARFGAADRGHDQPWFYYLERIWFDWAPWSLLLPSALVAAIRRGWRQPYVRLALFWFVATIVFLTFAATKREVYLLPAYPAIAFLLGWRFATSATESPTPRSRWFVACVGAAGVLVSITLLAGAVSPAMFPGSLPTRVHHLIDELAVPLTVLCAGLIAGGVLLLMRARKGLTMRTLATVAGLLWFIYAITLATILPRIDDERSYKAAAQWMRDASGAQPIGYYPRGIETKRAGFRVEDPAFMPLEVVSSPDAAAHFLSEAPRVVVLAAGQSEELAAVIPDWESVPKREFLLGTRRFLVLGPRREWPGP